MKHFTITFLLGIIMLGSCKQHEELSVTTAQPVDSILLSQTTIQDGTVSFSNSSHGLMFSYFSSAKDKVYTYISNKLADSSYVNSYFKSKNCFLYVDSQKNVFIMPLSENCIYKCNDSVIISRYQYHQSANQFSLVPISGKFEVIDNAVVMNRLQNVNLNIREQANTFFTSPSLIKLRLSNDSLLEINSFLNYPHDYIDIIYPFYWPFYVAINNDTLLYAFNPTEVGLTNTKSGNKTNLEIKGLTKNDYVVPNRDSSASLDYDKRTILNSDLYAGTLYDPVSHKAIIIQLLKYKENNSPLFTGIYEDKEVVLNVVNIRQQQVLKKISFPNQRNINSWNSYYFNNSFYVFSKSNNKIYIYSTR